MSKRVTTFRNVPNWEPSPDDYQLLFCEVMSENGYEWRECSHNIDQFKDMLLADYLDFMHIHVPDYTQFLRIYDLERDLHIEYRSIGGRVRIDVSPLSY